MQETQSKQKGKVHFHKGAPQRGGVYFPSGATKKQASLPSRKRVLSQVGRFHSNERLLSSDLVEQGLFRRSLKLLAH